MLKLSLLALVLLAAPAAFAQKPGHDKPGARAVPTEHSFVGTWDYVVQPDEPVAQGTFTIVQQGTQLGGTFMTDVPCTIDPFAPDGDAVAFTFKYPPMGVISIWGTLADDRFEGEAQPEGQGALPFVATRQGAQAAEGTDDR
jgi:hypothetical protein